GCGTTCAASGTSSPPGWRRRVSRSTAPPAPTSSPPTSAPWARPTASPSAGPCRNARASSPSRPRSSTTTGRRGRRSYGSRSASRRPCWRRRRAGCKGRRERGSLPRSGPGTTEPGTLGRPCRPAVGAGLSPRAAGDVSQGAAAPRAGGPAPADDSLVVGLVRRVVVLLQAELLHEPLVELDGGPHPAHRGRHEVLQADAHADEHLRLTDQTDGAVVVGVRVDLRPQGAAVPVVDGLEQLGLLVDLVRAVVERPHGEDLLVLLTAEHEVGTELLPRRREVTLVVDDVLQLHLVEELLHEVLIRDDGARRSLGLRLGLAPETWNRGRVDPHRDFPFVRIPPSSPMRGGAWQAPTGPVSPRLTRSGQ